MKTKTETERQSLTSSSTKSNTPFSYTRDLLEAAVQQERIRIPKLNISEKEKQQKMRDYWTDVLSPVE